ncbi:MAG: hypothetical protein AB4040_02260 [Synechococcus sp.]
MAKESDTVEPTMEDVQEPITTAPQQVKQIIERVLRIEKDRLDNNNRGHINEDILQVVKDEIR